MDIEHDGQIVRGVVELAEDNELRMRYEWRYVKHCDIGSSRYFNDIWTPVNEWVTIEVDRETFEQWYDDLPENYSDIFYDDNSEQGRMIKWRRTNK